MKLHYFSMVMAAAGLLIAGCQSKQEGSVRSKTPEGTTMSTSGELADKRDQALVRFVNADPALSNANAWLDSIHAFDGVNFKSVTPYREVPDGRHTLSLNEPMQGSRVDRNVDRDRRDDRKRDNAENSESFSGGNYYTVVAYPDKDNGRPKLTVIHDNFAEPTADKAKVRVIDASTAIGKVDIYTHGKKDALFSNVGSPDGDYKDIDPMTGTLEVRPAGKKNAIATVGNQSFEAGKAYTIILAGGTKASRKIDAVTVEDQLIKHRDSDRRAASDRKDRDNDRD